MGTMTVVKEYQQPINLTSSVPAGAVTLNDGTTVVTLNDGTTVVVLNS